MNTKRSEELFAKSLEKIPGGVNSPVRAFRAVGRNPLFIHHAEGSHITDVDGNTFIDYVCSWGPGILGHAHPQVIGAVKEACERGLTYGAPTENELILADMICEAMPSVEKVRLVSSGTEAVMSAIRVARGYTGRDYIIKFKGNYHGHSDGLLVKAGSAALTTAVPDSAGGPEGYTRSTLVALYNDKESVRALMEKYGDQVAAIIVEPVAANMGVVLPVRLPADLRRGDHRVPPGIRRRPGIFRHPPGHDDSGEDCGRRHAHGGLRRPAGDHGCGVPGGTGLLGGNPLRQPHRHHGGD